MTRATAPTDVRWVAKLATAAAVTALAAGFAALLVYCAVEAAASNLSLMDAYWRGRLPWMGIIEGLVVAGATACVLVGGLTVLAFGGWVRRLLVLALMALPGLWWLAAWMRAGISGGFCPGCPPPAFDPWAYAYSAPQLAALGLVLPAIAIATLALTASAARRAGAGYISPS